MIGYNEKLFYGEVGQILSCVQRCGISIPGGVQDSTGHSPECPDLGALGRGLG